VSKFTCTVSSGAKNELRPVFKYHYTAANPKIPRENGKIGAGNFGDHDGLNRMEAADQKTAAMSGGQKDA